MAKIYYDFLKSIGLNSSIVEFNEVSIIMNFIKNLLLLFIFINLILNSTTVQSNFKLDYSKSLKILKANLNKYEPNTTKKEMRLYYNITWYE